jgi:hypothetical protein
MSLAKAQPELTNPEKTLAATIVAPNDERRSPRQFPIAKELWGNKSRS